MPEVKPRRRRDDGDGEITDRKAFRLCIGEEDRAHLLDDTVWPESVFKSEWYFKPRDGRQDDDKRRRVDDQQQHAGTSTDTTSTSTSTTRNTAATRTNDPVSVVAEIHVNNEDMIVVSHMDDLSGDDGNSNQ